MSPLANQDPLAQLNDIIAPTAPHWFPPAPIYWVLLALTFVALFVVFYLTKKLKKQQQLQKSQLAKLSLLRQQQASFIELNQLLKGCVLTYFSREKVASLHGEQWFYFLQKYSTTPLFNDKQAFMARLYQTDILTVDEQDYAAAKKWISELPKQIKKVHKNV